MQNPYKYTYKATTLPIFIVVRQNEGKVPNAEHSIIRKRR